MPHDPADCIGPLRDALSQFATTVCVVTWGSRGHASGTTLSSVASLALEPPTLSFSIAAGGRLAAAAMSLEPLGITVLQREQQAIGQMFSDANRHEIDE